MARAQAPQHDTGGALWAAPADPPSLRDRPHVLPTPALLNLGGLRFLICKSGCWNLPRWATVGFSQPRMRWALCKGRLLWLCLSTLTHALRSGHTVFCHSVSFSPQGVPLPLLPGCRLLRRWSLLALGRTVHVSAVELEVSVNEWVIATRLWPSWVWACLLYVMLFYERCSMNKWKKKELPVYWGVWRLRMGPGEGRSQVECSEGSEWCWVSRSPGQEGACWVWFLGFASLVEVICWREGSSPFCAILIIPFPKRSYCKWRVMQSALLEGCQFLGIQWILCYLAEWVEWSFFLIKSSLQQKVTLSLLLKSPRSPRPGSNHPPRAYWPAGAPAVIISREHA